MYLEVIQTWKDYTGPMINKFEVMRVNRSSIRFDINVVVASIVGLLRNAATESFGQSQKF